MKDTFAVYILCLLVLYLPSLFSQADTSHESVGKNLRKRLQELLQHPEQYLGQNLFSEKELSSSALIIELKQILGNTSSPSLQQWALAFMQKLPQGMIAKLESQIHLCLQSPAWQVRKNAANLAYLLSSKKTVKLLLAQLADPMITVRDSAEYALEKLLSSEHGAVLLEAYKSMVSAQSRERIVWLARKLEGKKIDQLFTKALADESAKVRALACFYRLQTEKMPEEQLQKMVADSSWQVRHHIALALTENYLSWQEPFLTGLLYDAHEKVSAQAALAHRNPETLLTFVKKSWQAKQLNVAVIWAVSSLAQQKDPKAEKVIHKLLAQKGLSEYYQAILLYALSEFPNDKNIRRLISFLGSPSMFLRNVSLSALFKVASNLGVPSSREHNPEAWLQWLELHQSRLANVSNPPSSSLNSTSMVVAETPHYLIQTDIGEAFLTQAIILMEYLHAHYENIFSSRPWIECASQQDLQSHQGIKRFDENTYQLSSGEKVTFSPHGIKRTVYYPHGKTVFVLSNSIRKIKTPTGKLITKPYNHRATRQVTLKIFAQRKRFESYTKANEEWSLLQNAGAYYSPTRQEIVTCWDREKRYLISTLFHESLHHILGRYIFACPVWFNEGMAEYFDAYQWQEDHYTMGNPKLANILSLKQILANKDHLPLETLLQLDHYAFHPDSFGAQEYINYTTSWSLVYFLHKAENGKYIPLVKEYLVALQDGENSLSSFRRLLKNYGFANLQQLEQEWSEYFLGWEPD